MPKMKSHKGLRKRIKLSARGKLKYKKGNRGHLLSGKSGRRLRRLRRRGILANKGLAGRIRQAMQP